MRLSRSTFVDWNLTRRSWAFVVLASYVGDEGTEKVDFVGELGREGVMEVARDSARLERRRGVGGRSTNPNGFALI